MLLPAPCYRLRDGGHWPRSRVLSARARPAQSAGSSLSGRPCRRSSSTWDTRQTVQLSREGRSVCSRKPSSEQRGHRAGKVGRMTVKEAGWSGPDHTSCPKASPLVREGRGKKFRTSAFEGRLERRVQGVTGCSERGSSCQAEDPAPPIRSPCSGHRRRGVRGLAKRSLESGGAGAAFHWPSLGHVTIFELIMAPPIGQTAAGTQQPALTSTKDFLFF